MVDTAMKTVAVDLDGTLAEQLWTPEHPTDKIGDPLILNIAKLHPLLMYGYKIVIHTSRPWADYDAIEEWLKRNDVPYHGIICGKLLAAAYIDNKGRHSDADKWTP